MYKNKNDWKRRAYILELWIEKGQKYQDTVIRGSLSPSKKQHEEERTEYFQGICGMHIVMERIVKNIVK